MDHGACEVVRVGIWVRSNCIDENQLCCDDGEPHECHAGLGGIVQVAAGQLDDVGVPGLGKMSEHPFEVCEEWRVVECPN